MSNKIGVRSQLRLAVQKLDARGLQLSSKWACEQLVGMDSEDSSESADTDIEHSSSHHTNDDVPRHERDLVSFARNLLMSGEYQRCAHLLRHSINPTESSNNSVGIGHGTGPSRNKNAAAATSNPIPNSSMSNLAMFLLVYSTYMAGEKLKEQQETTDNINSGSMFPGMIGSTSASNEKQPNGEGHNTNSKAGKGSSNSKNSYDGDSKKNPFLNELFAELEPLYRKGCMDGFLLYLFAIVVRDLVKQGQIQGLMVINYHLLGQGGPRGLTLFNPSDSSTSKSQKSKVEGGLSAYTLFTESLQECAWNWSCWLELSELCLTEKLPPPTWQQLDPRLLSAQTVNQQFPSSSSKNNNGGNNRKGSGQEGRVMYLCFLAHYYLELQQGEKAMKVLEGVLHIFPNSQIATSQVALSHYCMRDYEKAQNVFEQARERDPHRIEHLDAYSNILYVRERRAELSYLAHSAMRLAPLTPETCCVVGNYYSLKGKHERAILYFQRALKLNPKCLSAWTLMGHECVELRNTAAAVQCYRKAVDVSSGGDYRAWYGLGQTYEMLHMYQYALYYYKSAAALRPSDGRMWCAVGNCLCRLGTKAEATKAFERAVAAGDREGVATRELARLYRDGGLAGKAAECYYHHLLLTGGEELITAVQRVVQGIASVPIGSAAPSSLYGMSSGDGSGGHMDELISGADEVVDAERAEALLYLAGYYKGQGMMAQAELLCSRLMDKVGSEGDEARAMMREIRTLSLIPGVIVPGTEIGSNRPLFSDLNTDPNKSTQPNFSQSKSSTGWTQNTSHSNLNISRSIYNDREGMNESKISQEFEEEDSMELDAARVEGELSMSMSGSENGNEDLDDSGFRSFRAP